LAEKPKAKGKGEKKSLVLKEIVDHTAQTYHHRISCFKFSPSKTCHTVTEPKDRTMEVWSSNPLLANGSPHSLRQAV